MHDDKKHEKDERSLHNYPSQEYTIQHNTSHDKHKTTANIESSGCPHYTRSCMIIADCCKRTYPCRLCHDDNEEHRIDRHSTKEMLCLLCGTIQSINKYCIKCNKCMGRYFCNICKFWSDSYNDKIFHCHKCKLCRHGVLNLTVYHCDICNACMDIKLKDNHVHIENNLSSDCPICAEYLFTSIKNVVLLKCGHAMHLECFDYYLLRNYQCPICQKSAGDTFVYNKKINLILEDAKSLNEKDYKNWVCEINCYDCREKSVGGYNYMFNKCRLCESFNTRLGDIQKPEKE